MAHCGIDVTCIAVENIQQAIVGLIVPYVIPILLLLAALFVFPRAGRKGWVMSIIIIVGVVWWFFGFLGIPSLRSLVGA